MKLNKNEFGWNIIEQSNDNSNYDDSVIKEEIKDIKSNIEELEMQFDNIVNQIGNGGNKVLEDLLPNRQLIWHDEFDSPNLDETKWGHLVGGYKADRHRYYMYEDVTKNVYCSNSILHITNLKDFPTDTIKFSGAFIHTFEKFEFRYGRVEAKIKFPNAPAYHGTLWSMSTNYIPEDMLKYSGISSNRNGSSKGENDIAECDNKNVTCVLHSTANDSFGIKSYGNGTDWHIYACEWTETDMKYYRDGVLINTINISPANNSDGSLNPFKKPHFLMLNMNPFLNNESDQTQDFLDWEIDWVRVYAPLENKDLKESSISLSASEINLSTNTNTFRQLIPTFTPNICNQTIKWESYNEQVAIVKGGDVFAVGAGTTYVRAMTNNGNVAYCKVIVNGESSYEDLGVTYNYTFETISDTGTITNSQNTFLLTYRPVVGKDITVTCPSASIIRVAEYDSDKNFIRRTHELGNYYYVNVSDNASYIRVCITTDEVINDTLVTSTIINGVNVILDNESSSTQWVGGYIDSTGNISTSGGNSGVTNVSTEDYIDIQPNTPYIIHIDSSIIYDSVKIAEYDENKIFISRVLTNDITTSSNAKYMRITLGYSGGIDPSKVNSTRVYPIISQQ